LPQPERLLYCLSLKGCSIVAGGKRSAATGSRRANMATLKGVVLDGVSAADPRPNYSHDTIHHAKRGEQKPSLSGTSSGVCSVPVAASAIGGLATGYCSAGFQPVTLAISL